MGAENRITVVSPGSRPHRRQLWLPQAGELGFDDRPVTPTDLLECLTGRFNDLLGSESVVPRDPGFRGPAEIDLHRSSLSFRSAVATFTFDDEGRTRQSHGAGHLSRGRGPVTGEAARGDPVAALGEHEPDATS